ncbi:NAD(P)-binding protein [Aspergillus steynii IBT 23096]|uniref:NAD(P)-binding protein n=1 Tax=Aspergillus steynii IBT 23096 TaxID=1392250 RepID=A0A2I2GES7_9EURO|nr:NAD(P)-binding protein [Aspergillus steynii IBT 23096]PLB51389.1 NAD(P)-binding protein [Aspergillus steynii IBT 23096]
MPSEACIEKVAIVGAAGNIGSHFTRELLKTGKHTVTAITRVGSTSPIPEGAQRVEVNYNNSETLVDALRGQQFLIVTLSIYSPPHLHGLIVRAASAAGVPYIMPNVYSNDLLDEALRNEDLYGAAALDRCHDIEQQGNTAYIAMVCGFWYEWSLAMGEQWFGFDLTKKSVTFFDDGTTPITSSSPAQCGRAVAALLSLPEAKVAQWKNQLFYVASFTVSQRDMLDSVHRVMGTTDADWTIRYEPCRQRYNDGLAEMQNGIRTGYAKAMYTRAFFKNGGGDFESRRELANDTIGLPKEELDEATRRAVEFGPVQY